MANKNIKFEYKGIKYTLEFTKRTERMMEANGFNIGLVGEKPQTMIPELFAGAFLCNHRSTKRELIDEIYDQISDKEGLLTKLGEMYNEPLEALMDSQGNLNWEASW